MFINADTKIATLLKHHADALEAIITLSPDFKKLRNPFLRKLMAGRTSIAMASKIGGCTPEAFFKKLQPLGFDADTLTVTSETISQEQKPMPAFINNMQASQTITLDVRPMLAAGNDPLQLIQQRVKALQQGQVLKIINTFEPTPLINLLGRRGFVSYVKQVKENVIETYFYKETQEKNELLNTDSVTVNDWDALLEMYAGNLQEIDVRHLEMPQPMMTILSALEILPANKALYVHHKRIPVFLLTELKERQFDYRIKEITDSEVFLLIFRN
ncbi:hypothetical protein BH10BAC3_BH10BAC3_09090 [soil metagenome]